MGFIIWVNILVLAFWQHFCCSQGHSEYHAATPCAKLKPNCPLSTRSHTIIYISLTNPTEPLHHSTLSAKVSEIAMSLSDSNLSWQCKCSRVLKVT